MVLLLAPSELTRLVEKAEERVQLVMLGQHTVCSPEDDFEAGSECELRAYCHLEQLGDGLVVACHFEGVLGDDSDSVPVVVMMDLGAVHILLQERVGIVVGSALKALLFAALFTVEELEVADVMVFD